MHGLKTANYKVNAGSRYRSVTYFRVASRSHIKSGKARCSSGWTQSLPPTLVLPTSTKQRRTQGD
jgi:hypothetical protein